MPLVTSEKAIVEEVAIQKLVKMHTCTVSVYQALFLWQPPQAAPVESLGGSISSVHLELVFIH